MTDLATRTDAAAIEKAEASLNNLIERQAKAASKASAEEDLWKMSVRRHNAAVRRRNVALWYAHFCQMADNHAALAADYAERAERLCQEGAA